MVENSSSVIKLYMMEIEFFHINNSSPLIPFSNMNGHCHWISFQHEIVFWHEIVSSITDVHQVQCIHTPNLRWVYNALWKIMVTMPCKDTFQQIYCE